MRRPQEVEDRSFRHPALRRFAIREEALDLLNEELRSWALGRHSIPTIVWDVVWDVDERKIIAEVHQHSCEGAVRLLGEVLGQPIGLSMYACGACRWSD